MTLRGRLRLAFLAIVLLPVIGLALAVRAAMTDRLISQYQRRVDALVAIIEDDLAFESDEIRGKLAAIALAAADDNRLRLAAVSGLESERAYLLDYAGDAMRRSGLAMLQIQNARGRIISSGHFRNEYDRIEPGLQDRLATALGGMALLEARAPDGPFLTLAAIDSFSVGGRRFSVVGGESVQRSFLARLARASELSVTLVYPGGVLSSSVDAGLEAALAIPDSTRSSASGERVVAELGVPFIDADRGELSEARIVVTHAIDELRALRRDLDRWFIIAVAVTATLAFLLATWLASRISRPLADLAHKTSRIDLDRLDIDFRSGRKDEVGSLSRLLGAMTERLRTGTARLKEAERRATIGELARQVNHDIKNGLMPIRNVLRHLAEVAHQAPDQLPGVFAERKGTIDSSITYLEELASNYARLSPRMERQSCDIDEIVGQVMASIGGREGVDLQARLEAQGATVDGDPVALRRIVENLVDNAIDSLASGAGSVTVATEPVKDDDDVPAVRITISDTGCGMTPEQLVKIFDDFYTTKTDGTGLGLSIVKRLVVDLNGNLRVESEAGQGSTFFVQLPAHAAAPGAGANQGGVGG
ncbi:MAG TPA: HAMP domain-containing sensor histidine kinase [Gemmatimonadota bacterium]|nr:HAMP domain-containing sensor histidine kinase [Gemmatimonadota bacterium]